MAEWIPVTERLPEEGEYVLVRFNNNEMAVACLFGRDENFTFWMLPPPTVIAEELGECSHLPLLKVITETGLASDR